MSNSMFTNIRSILFTVKFSFHKDCITYEDNLWVGYLALQELLIMHDDNLESRANSKLNEWLFIAK